MRPRPAKALTQAQLNRRAEIGEERRAKTRAKLIDAAYGLFAARGADAPTIDDIIAAAAVARGTFYNHFDTRDDCFKAVADEIATFINRLILPQIEQLTDPAARVSLAMRLFIHFAVADEARGWILLRTMPLVGSLNLQMKSFIESQFTQAIAEGRFRATSVSHAMDLSLGLEIMTIHRLLVDRLDLGYIDSAAEMLLLALGVAPTDIADVLALPVNLSGVTEHAGG